MGMVLPEGVDMCASVVDSNLLVPCRIPTCDGRRIADCLRELLVMLLLYDDRCTLFVAYGTLMSADHYIDYGVRYLFVTYHILMCGDRWIADCLYDLSVYDFLRQYISAGCGLPPFSFGSDRQSLASV